MFVGCLPTMSDLFMTLFTVVVNLVHFSLLMLKLEYAIQKLVCSLNYVICNCEL
jgi:hypothetical protein